MLCLQERKLALYLGQFKKYRLTNRQVVKLSTQSGGVLATRVSNFVGLYDMMKQYGIKASEVNKILDVLPEFAL